MALAKPRSGILSDRLMPSPSWSGSQKHRFANESMAKAQAAHFLKDLLVSFLRESLPLGAVVICAIVIGAVVIRSCEPDNPVHLTFQRGFNDCRLALSASDAAHVRRVQFELAGDAAVKAPEEGCEVERGGTHATFDFCHHSCYFLS